MCVEAGFYPARLFYLSLRQRFALPPQLRFAAQPSVRTGPPRRGRRGGVPRLRARRGDEGIAPYGRATRVRRVSVSPTSLTEGGFKRPPRRGRRGRTCGRGDADSHASDVGHWLGMTPQEVGAVGQCTNFIAPGRHWISTLGALAAYSPSSAQDISSSVVSTTFLTWRKITPG